MIGLQGPSLLYEERKLIEEENIGGVLLFGRNCLEYSQVKKLCLELLSLKQKEPLLIAIDREGPQVNRLRKIKKFLNWPAFSEIPESLIEEASFFMHQELKHLGINLNLSPVLDISNKKSRLLEGRTLSRSPEKTGFKGQAIIRGALRAGVLPCVKHFPGHGGVSEDSHLTLPIDNRPRGKIMEHILPFRQAFASKAPSVMLSHILYKALDEKNPCPLSSKIIQNLLREELCFRGLILSDDLNMKAASHLSPALFAEKALQAGVGMLIIGDNQNQARELLEFFKEKASALIEKRGREMSEFKKKHLIWTAGKPPPAFHPRREAFFQKLSQ